jgi:heme/copper-type cytochrome/quinol oxidase subunit 3
VWGFSVFFITVAALANIEANLTSAAAQEEPPLLTSNTLIIIKRVFTVTMEESQYIRSKERDNPSV